MLSVVSNNWIPRPTTKVTTFEDVYTTECFNEYYYFLKGIYSKHLISDHREL